MIAQDNDRPRVSVSLWRVASKAVGHYSFCLSLPFSSPRANDCVLPSRMIYSIHSYSIEVPPPIALTIFIRLHANDRRPTTLENAVISKLLS